MTSLAFALSKILTLRRAQSGLSRAKGAQEMGTRQLSEGEIQFVVGTDRPDIGAVIYDPVRSRFS